MLGNLSKVLIKAPLFFNNKTQTKRKNTLQKIPEENILDPFYQINHIKKRGNSLSGIYFKERDFWKKNLKLDINFNNNKRLHKYDFHSIDMDLDKEKNEQNLILLDNNNSNKNDVFNKNRRYFNFISDSPMKTSKGRNKNVNTYKKIFLFQKDNNNLNDSDISLKSDERMSSFLNTENNNIKRDTLTHINSYKNDINTNEENINTNKSFENANNNKGRNKLVSEKYDNLVFAIGTAYEESSANVRTALHIADELMYDDKKHYYELHPEKRRSSSETIKA